MQELIAQLVDKAGISADQASKVINVVKDFAKEKFPMLGGAVDNLFGASDDAQSSSGGSDNLIDKAKDFLG
jgi:hypothetical protein